MLLWQDQFSTNSSAVQSFISWIFCDKSHLQKLSSVPIWLYFNPTQFCICRRTHYGHFENENPSNIEGLTPLHEAAINGHVKICKIIIDTLVNRNPPDDNGITPLYLASKNGHFEFCRLIQCKRQTYTKWFFIHIYLLWIMVKNWNMY